MKIWAVVVFESGDMTTSVWGVFDSEEKAKEYEKELQQDIDLNNGDHYLATKVSEHEVQ